MSSVKKPESRSLQQHHDNTTGRLEQYDCLSSQIADDDDYILVPPDGGWGWLVLAGSMLVNILVPGTIKSFGVLFVEFLEAFKASPSTAAWIPALCYFLYSSLGPVSSILSIKYSFRTVTLIGGTFAALGMILSFWASSVTYLYMSYGILVGAGAGLSFPPTVYIVTSYFERLRGLANGLCISGSALGSIILPPFLRFLLDTYGYRGSILLMGGITLNVWVAALFYEPVERHLKKISIKSKNLNDICEEDDGIVLQFKEGAHENFNQERRNQTSVDLKALNNSPLLALDSTVDQENFLHTSSFAAIQHIGETSEDTTISFCNRGRKTNVPTKTTHRNHVSSDHQLSSSSSLYTVPENVSKAMDNRTAIQIENQKSIAPKRSPSTSSFQYISTPYHGSTLSFQPQEFSSHLSLRSNTSLSKKKQNSMEPNNEKNLGKNNEKKKLFFDLSLLKDAVYLIILVSNSTNAIGYTNFIILLPAYALEMGFNKSLAAYLISIVSALDLVGRIGGSALSDTGLIPKTWYFFGGLAVSGLALALLPLTTSYSMLSVCCGVFGLASGIYVGITAIIMADLLGTERLTSSYGISLFVNGILQLIGPPICGIWFERVGSFAPLFTTLGITLLAGASLWGIMPFVQHRRDKKAKQHNSK